MSQKHFSSSVCAANTDNYGLYQANAYAVYLFSVAWRARLQNVNIGNFIAVWQDEGNEVGTKTQEGGYGVVLYGEVRYVATHKAAGVW